MIIQVLWSQLAQHDISVHVARLPVGRKPVDKPYRIAAFIQKLRHFPIVKAMAVPVRARLVLPTKKVIAFFKVDIDAE